MKKNNNRSIHTGTLLVAALAFGQMAQAAPLILGGNQTVNTDLVTESVVVGNSGAGPTGGNGDLTIDNGATLTNSGTWSTLGLIGGVNYRSGWSYLGHNTGSTGTATVSGANSHWQNSDGPVIVGNFGHGTLSVQGGGQVTSAEGNLGIGASSTGIATVIGANSVWQNSGQLFVGSGGNGTLNIENGGKVTNANGQIGINSGSTGAATVTGANSRWENSGTLYVGNSGKGTLNIGNGGYVTNTTGALGVGSGAGVATITGANSHWQNSGELIVGNQGNGMLNIKDGGRVTNTTGSLGSSVNSTGIVTVTGSGSHWENTNRLLIGGVSAGARGQGSLTIDDGGVVSATNGVTIWSTGSLSGNSGTLDSDVINHGLIDPTEVLTITGDLALIEASILALDIFGPTMYDQLFIGGDFFIDGLLTLDFDGFTQSAFDTTYDLIHIGGDIIGAWSDFDINVAGFDSALLGYSIVGSSVDGYSRALRLTVAGTGDTGGNPGDPGTNPIPEPASGLLIGLGGWVMLMLRRRNPGISLA
mgnify:CR=1 FL=1